MSHEQDESKRHHHAGGYRNNYADFSGKSLAEVIRWRWDARKKGLPRPPETAIPHQAPDIEHLLANAKRGKLMQAGVTWIGHATVLAQLGGLSVLTDPIFSDRASPFQFTGPKRHQPPGLAISDLPHIDLVLVSHNHYDHLDDASVRALARQGGGPPLYIVPLGLKSWLGRRGIRNVVELDWWDEHKIGDVTVSVVPAQHWSSRGISDHMKTLWGGFAVFAPDCHLFYAGDTAYSRDFCDIRERFARRQGPAAGGGFDIALLPIGAYEPRWFMAGQHVNVEEAIKIHRDLNAKCSLGVHWGTFELTDEPLDEPPKLLSVLSRECNLRPDEFVVVAIGETRHIQSRSA